MNEKAGKLVLLKQERNEKIRHIKADTRQKLKVLGEELRKEIANLGSNGNASKEEIQKIRESFTPASKTNIKNGMKEARATMKKFKEQIKEARMEVVKDNLIKKGVSQEIVDQAQNILQLKLIEINFERGDLDLNMEKILTVKDIKDFKKFFAKNEVSLEPVLDEVEKIDIEDSVEDALLPNDEMISEEVMSLEEGFQSEVRGEEKIIDLNAPKSMMAALHEVSDDPVQKIFGVSLKQVSEVMNNNKELGPYLYTLLVHIGDDKGINFDFTDEKSVQLFKEIQTPEDLAYYFSQKVASEMIGENADELTKERFNFELVKMIANAHPGDLSSAIDEITMENAQEFIDQHILELNQGEVFSILSPKFIEDLQNDLGLDSSLEDFFDSFENHIFVNNEYDSVGETIFDF